MCANALRECRLREVRVQEKGSEAGMEENRYGLRYFWAGHSVATTHSCLLRHMGCLQRFHMDPPHFRTVGGEERQAVLSSPSLLWPLTGQSSASPPDRECYLALPPAPQGARASEGTAQQCGAQVSLLSGGSGFVAMRPSSKAPGLRARQDKQLWGGT